MQSTTSNNRKSSSTFKKAAAEGKQVGEPIKEGHAPVLEVPKEEKLDRMYGGLMALAGICKDPIHDASTTIDEMLYGATSEEKANKSRQLHKRRRTNQR